MKKNNYLLTALLCTGLSVAGLLTGCNGGGSGVDAPNTKGAVTTPISFGNDDKLQFIYSRFEPPTTLSDQTRLGDGNTTGFPADADFPQFVRQTTSPTSTFPPTLGLVVNSNGTSRLGGGNVTVGNVAVTRDDQGVLNLSGALTPTGGTQASQPNLGPAVFTAVSPDRKFAYGISSVGIAAQAFNISAPPLGDTANSVINATTLTVPTPAGTNATSIVNTTQTRVQSYGAFGANRATTMAINATDGTLQPPPFALNTQQFGTQATLNYAIVHPSGSFLYIFGDDITANVTNTNPNVVELDPPFVDTVTYQLNTTGLPNVVVAGTPEVLADPAAMPPVAGSAATASNITFVPVASSSGRTLGRRGFVMKVNINRTTGEPDFINRETISLPAGFATPNHVLFGPGGTDMYIACYSVANNPANRSVSAGGVLHYKLSQAGGSVTGSLPAVPTGQFVMPRGTHSLALSQGSRRLYATCQIDGSVRCLSVNPNTGALALQPSGDILGLTSPGPMVAHPTFDRLYVGEGRQTNIGGPAGTIGGAQSVKVLSVDSATGVLSQLFSGPVNMPNTNQLKSLAIDPNGQIIYAQGDAAGVPTIVGNVSTSPFFGDVGEVGVLKVAADGSFTLRDILGLPGYGRLGEVYKLVSPSQP
jgi:hypothetical protein